VYGENDSPAAAPNWGINFMITVTVRPHRMQSMRMQPVVTDVAWSFCVSVCSINQSINQSTVCLLCSKPKNYET